MKANVSIAIAFLIMAPIEATDLECVGPIMRTYGGAEWLLTVCSPFVVKVAAAPRNPAEAKFTLGFNQDRFKYDAAA